MTVIELFVLAIVGAVGLIAAFYLGNTHSVEHEDRKRIIVRNVLEGTLRVLPAGTSAVGEGEVFDTEVDLNKNPRNTGEEGHRCSSSDRTELILKARYNMRTGLRFDDKTGKVDDPPVIHDKTVLLAVTKTDFKTRGEYVDGIVAAAVDAVVGHFTVDELIFPHEANKGNGFDVPKTATAAGTPPALVKSKAELYQQLAIAIQDETNYRLRDVGFSVDEVLITNLDYASTNPKAAAEQIVTNRNLAKAARQLKGFRGLSAREKLALGTAHQGPVAAAQAQIDLANAQKDVAKTAANAVIKVSENIADGLRNFGHGP